MDILLIQFSHLDLILCWRRLLVNQQQIDIWKKRLTKGLIMKCLAWSLNTGMFQGLELAVIAKAKYKGCAHRLTVELTSTCTWSRCRVRNQISTLPPQKSKIYWSVIFHLEFSLALTILSFSKVQVLFTWCPTATIKW